MPRIWCNLCHLLTLAYPRSASSLAWKARPQIVILALREPQLILLPIEPLYTATPLYKRLDQTALPRSSITTTLPPHPPSHPHLPHKIRLALYHPLRIERDHHLLLCIVAPTRSTRSIPVTFFKHLRARLRQNLVVPDALLPASLTCALEMVSRPLGPRKRPPVHRHPQHDLLCSHTMPDIVLHRCLRAKRRRMQHILGRVQIRLVSRPLVPRAGIVVRHQVPEIQILVHLS